MTAPRHCITTTVPYVNARPHLGFALELVQADTLARHRRQRGADVRLLSGTDDKLVLPAVPPRGPAVGADRRRHPAHRTRRPPQRGPVADRGRSAPPGAVVGYRAPLPSRYLAAARFTVRGLPPMNWFVPGR